MAGHSMEHDHKREEARAAKGGVCVEGGRGDEGGATLRASFPPLPSPHHEVSHIGCDLEEMN